MPTPKIRKVKFSSVELADDLPQELDVGKLRYVGHGLDSLRDWRGRRRRTIELDQDVAKIFTSAEQVNETLRKVIELRNASVAKKRRSA